MKTCCLVWEIPVIEGEHYNPACTYNEIFSSENQAVIFAPEAKTRQWLYKKEMQAVSIPKYYLDFAEYNEVKLDKIAIFFMNLKNDIQ